MNLNSIGTHVKRGMSGSLNRLFGIIRRPELSQSKLNRGVKPTSSYFLDNQTRKILLDAEVRKTQAIELARQFQNC